jgi:hypothetical protein
MGLERVAELVHRAAQDTGVFQALKANPRKLQSALQLTGAELEALHSATAFPVGPVQTKASTQKRAAGDAAVLKAGVSAQEVASTGGSLLPPEGSGQFTGATGGFRPSPTPGPPVTPQRPAPSPQAPTPAPGTVPTPTPSVPVPQIGPTQPSPGPTYPMVPPMFPQMTHPQICPPPTGEPGVPAQGQGSCNCSCCAIAGMVSAVSVTATTAITAITAITGLAARRS